MSNKLQVLAHAEVKFDSDLPEFRTTGGVNAGANNEYVNYYYTLPYTLLTHPSFPPFLLLFLQVLRAPDDVDQGNRPGTGSSSRAGC